MPAVTAFPDPGAFLEGTASFRAGEPVLTNVIGSVAESVLAGREYDAYLWLAVRDQAGDVIGCALRTAPYHLVVSPMPLSAAVALGRHVREVDARPPGVNGPRDVVEAVVAQLPAAASARVAMRDLAHVLDRYVPAPADIPGRARRATEDDTELLSTWLRQFAIDAGLRPHDPSASIADALSREAVWLWEVADRPVALAGHASLVITAAGTVARIGPVYTPASDRGRGFGSAVTGAVIEALRPRATTIMLFADADNPTSNGVYERLGFRVVAEIVEMELDVPA